MDRRRRSILLAGAGALAAPFAAIAQRAPGKPAAIGFLGPGAAAAYASWMQTLRASLAEAGYVEPKNLVMELRYAEGRYERLPRLAAELVERDVDVIVISSTTAALAAKKATATIPIVMTLSADP